MQILLAALLLSGAPVTLDGDTIVIDGTRIRIANIDAPEIRDFHCDARTAARPGLPSHRMTELLASGPDRVSWRPGQRPAKGSLWPHASRPLHPNPYDFG